MVRRRADARDPSDQSAVNECVAAARVAAAARPHRRTARTNILCLIRFRFLFAAVCEARNVNNHERERTHTAGDASTKGRKNIDAFG
jgi:hypothetical protein